MQDFKPTPDQLIRCLHRKEFPPPRLGSVEEMNTAYQKGVISSSELEKFKIWKRVCGLTEMGNKCMTCPHARQVRMNPMVPHEEELVPLR